MKKISLLLCAILLVLSFAACSNKEDTSSDVPTKEVVASTEATVSDAFEKTATKLEEKIMNFSVSKVVTSSAEGESTEIIKNTDTVRFDFRDEKYNIIYSGTKTNDAGTVTSIIYCDNEKLYGTHLKGTYLMKMTDSAKKALNDYADLVEIFLPTNLKAIDTAIVNTDLEGCGFIFEYDPESVDKEFFESLGDIITDDFKDVKVSLVKISGLINKDGLITNQVVTLEYTTTVTETVPKEPSSSSEESSSKANSSKKTTSKNNSSKKNSSEEASSVETIEITKEVKKEVTIETKYDYSTELDFSTPKDIDVAETEDYTIEDFQKGVV